MRYPSSGGHKPTPLIAEIQARRQAAMAPSAAIDTCGATTPDASPSDVPPKIRIAVTRLTPCRAGNLLGFASVKVGKWLEIHGLRIIEQPGQRRWVGMPANARDVDDPERPGEKRRTYFSLIDLPKPWQRTAEQMVLAAWADYEATGILPDGAAIGGNSETKQGGQR